MERKREGGKTFSSLKIAVMRGRFRGLQHSLFNLLRSVCKDGFSDTGDTWFEMPNRVNLKERLPAANYDSDC
eukprot:1068981-Amphidinium_carterae.1